MTKIKLFDDRNVDKEIQRGFGRKFVSAPQGGQISCTEYTPVISWEAPGKQRRGEHQPGDSLTKLNGKKFREEKQD